MASGARPGRQEAAGHLLGCLKRLSPSGAESPCPPPPLSAGIPPTLPANGPLGATRSIEGAPAAAGDAAERQSAAHSATEAALFQKIPLPPPPTIVILEAWIFIMQPLAPSRCPLPSSSLCSPRPLVHFDRALQGPSDLQFYGKGDSGVG